MAHSIRLRGPWEYQPLARAALLADGTLSQDGRGLPGGGTVVMPGDWGATLGSDFRGLARFTRRFAQPTGLDESASVWLVVEDIDWQGTVVLNGAELGTARFSAAPATDGSSQTCPARFDITALLQPRNTLTIDVLLPAVAAGALPISRPGREGLPGGLIGLVRLEIETM